MRRRTSPARWAWRILFLGLPLALSLFGLLLAQYFGDLDVLLEDVGAPSRAVPGAEVALLDAEGEVLARGRTERHFGALLLDYPEFGDCPRAPLLESEAEPCRLERAAWEQRVGEAVRALSLTTAGCRLNNVPAQASPDYGPALTWWVPLRGIGGPPYARYELTLRLDLAACRPQVVLP